ARSLTTFVVLPFGLGQHGLHFLDKVVDVLEFAIHGGKAYVSHLIEHFQVIHDPFAQDGNGNLGKVVGPNLTFDLLDNGIDLFGADGPFVARLLQSSAELSRIERLPRFVLLDYLERHFFNNFYRPHPALTMCTTAPPTDRKTARVAARINYLESTLAAKGTFHKSFCPPILRFQKGAF